MKAGLKDWIALCRAEHAPIVFLAVIGSQFVVTKRLAWEMIFPAIGPVLISIAAFIWNDYFGIKTDRAMKRFDRPLVSGKIKPKTAFYVSLTLFALGVLLSSLANTNTLIIAGVFAAASMLYDPIFKKYPLVGNAFIASSMSISFLYGNYAVSNQLHPFVLLFMIVSFTAGLGRELVLTLRDVKGDKKIGARTFPMVFGAKATVILALTLFHIAVVMSLVPLLQNASVAYMVLIVITNVLILLSAWKLALDQSLPSLKKIRNYTLYALLIGVLAFSALGL